MKQKILTSLLVAMATVGLSSPAMASTITNLDLTNAAPFGGFDWSSNGTALLAPVPVPSELKKGDPFTAYYFADATAILKEGGGNFITDGLLKTAPDGSFGAGQYQYTIMARFDGEVTDIIDDLAKFKMSGRSWDVYYDHAGLKGTVADQIAGTGFDDGVRVLGGNVLDQSIGFFDTVKNVGTFEFSGAVNFTNPDYIAPNQTDTIAVSTLQFGPGTTDWTAATGTPWGSLPVSSQQFQADGNQTFTVVPVPEPGTLALLGLGMFGLFATTRKRYNSVV